MFTLKQATLLALVGTTLAAPLAHRGFYDGPMVGRLPGMYGYNNGQSGQAEETTTVTVVYGTQSSPDSTVTIQPVPEAAAPSAAAPTSSPDVSSAAPNVGASGGQDDYMSIVSKWRAAGGLPALTQDSKLEGNAAKTVRDGNGKMAHELNPGTFGQVLAPGNDGNFESVYVGGWLCEISSLPGLNGVCSSMTKGWDHSNGETGHAEILTSTKYTKIGCALGVGIWACDLA